MILTYSYIFRKGRLIVRAQPAYHVTKQTGLQHRITSCYSSCQLIINDEVLHSASFLAGSGNQCFCLQSNPCLPRKISETIACFTLLGRHGVAQAGSIKKDTLTSDDIKCIGTSKIVLHQQVVIARLAPRREPLSTKHRYVSIAQFLAQTFQNAFRCLCLSFRRCYKLRIWPSYLSFSS